MAVSLQDEATRRAVESFVFREARLLDGHQYEDWLELWTDDARYWVPSNRGDIDPDHEVSIIYDDRQRLADRVFRMRHPAAHACNQLPRVTRVVSNLEIEAAPNTSVVVVHSAYVLVSNRPGEAGVFAGRVRHGLVGVDEGFRMATKKVVLTANDDALRNITFLP